jgi:hypothetical protein
MKDHVSLLFLIVAATLVSCSSSLCGIGARG